MSAQRFRKRPVVIEAMQFTEDTTGDLNDWLAAGEASFIFLQSPGRISLAIDTLEGTHTAHPGDWIIRGVKGEHYPCKADIFDQTHEAMSASEATGEAPPVASDLVERVARFIWECDSEGAFTWESVAEDYRGYARQVIALVRGEAVSDGE